MNGGCFGVDNHGHHCESALPVLVRSEWRLRADNDEMFVRVVCHCLYVVNGGCFRADNDRNDCESALPPLVRSEWTLLGS